MGSRPKLLPIKLPIKQPEFIEKKVPLPEEIPEKMPEQIKDLRLAPGSKNFYISQDAPMGINALYQSYLDPKRFDFDAAQGKRGETFFRTKIGDEELDLLPIYANDEEEGIASLLGYRTRIKPPQEFETIMVPNPSYIKPIDAVKTPPPRPKLIEDYFKSEFYDPMAIGTQVVIPVKLPTGEDYTFTGGAPFAGFQNYLESIGEMPAEIIRDIEVKPI